jgi:putative ABC transport system permease protein
VIKQFGFASPQEAVGKWMAFDWEGQPQQFTIIGVVKNFHFKDLHEQIEPIAFRMYNNADFNYLVAHAGGGDLRQSLTGLEAAWKKLNSSSRSNTALWIRIFKKTTRKKAGRPP